MSIEKSLVLLKPDAVERKLVGEIIARFEKRNLEILQIKIVRIDRSVAEEHYSHVKSEPIYESMIEYFTSGPVVALVLQGENAIKLLRNMIGKTSSLESPSGTIRGDYGYHRFQNLIHASDSVENAEIEINRFFPELLQ